LPMPVQPGPAPSNGSRLFAPSAPSARDSGELLNDSAGRGEGACIERAIRRDEHCTPGDGTPGLLSVVHRRQTRLLRNVGWRIPVPNRHQKSTVTLNRTKRGIRMLVGRR
jgi:hypothetical protein